MAALLNSKDGLLEKLFGDAFSDQLLVSRDPESNQRRVGSKIGTANAANGIESGLHGEAYSTFVPPMPDRAAPRRLCGHCTLFAKDPPPHSVCTAAA